MALLKKEIPDFNSGKLMAENPKLLRELMLKYNQDEGYYSFKKEYTRKKNGSFRIEENGFLINSGHYVKYVINFCENCGDDLRKLK